MKAKLKNTRLYHKSHLAACSCSALFYTQFATSNNLEPVNLTCILLGGSCSNCVWGSGAEKCITVLLVHCPLHYKVCKPVVRKKESLDIELLTLVISSWLPYSFCPLGLKMTPRTTRGLNEPNNFFNALWVLYIIKSQVKYLTCISVSAPPLLSNRIFKNSL